MSFSRDIKLQIMEHKLTNDCCELAFLCGLFHSCGQIKIENGQADLYLSTDLQKMYDFINDTLSSLYGEYAEIEIVDEYKINKTTYYKIIFPESLSYRLLLDTGMIKFDEKNQLVKNEIVQNEILQDDCCRRSFVKGCFLGCGTSSIKLSEEPNVKTRSGYHIEFTSHNHDFLQSLSEILAGYNILPKLISRRNLFVLYVKEASQISDLLALLEAFDCALELNSELAKRELRNKVNRQTNCMSGNISKMVNASLRQTKAISAINDIVGLESLPMDLQLIALLRLANPEESLDDLIKIGGLSLTKSGLNHRLKKLEKIAEELEK